MYGVTKADKTNDFAFDAMLTKRNKASNIPVLELIAPRVFDIIEKHAEHKPVIVFCATRRDVVKCAKTVAADYNTSGRKAWRVPQEPNNHFRDKDLNDLSGSGVSFHHAGLDMADRVLVEKLYLDGTISVIAATSTLAVGVNLPAHLVILKNTLQYAAGSFQEYSDIEVLQMSKSTSRDMSESEQSSRPSWKASIR